MVSWYIMVSRGILWYRGVYYGIEGYIMISNNNNYGPNCLVKQTTVYRILLQYTNGYWNRYIMAIITRLGLYDIMTGVN